MSLAIITQQFRPGHKGKCLENECFQLQSAKMNFHSLVQDCIHFKVFSLILLLFSSSSFSHPKFSQKCLNKTWRSLFRKESMLWSHFNKVFGILLARKHLNICLSLAEKTPLTTDASTQPVLDCALRHWDIFWPVAKEKEESEEMQPYILRASWFWIVTVVWHWQEWLDQQQSLLGCKTLFQPQLHPHHALKWLSEHRNTRDWPKEATAGALSAFPTPHPFSCRTH